MADSPGQSTGSIGPTRFGALAAAFIIGAMLGFAVVSLTVRLHGSAPRVELRAISALAVIAGALGVLALTTYRTVHRDRRRIDSARAVSFLLLAKSSALGGAVIAGGYSGFILQFLDQLDAPLPRERVLRGGAAAITAVALVVAALLLERACRVPKDEDGE